MDNIMKVIKMEEKLNQKLEKIKADIDFHEYRIVDSTNEIKLLKEMEKMFTEYIAKIPKEE